MCITESQKEFLEKIFKQRRRKLPKDSVTLSRIQRRISRELDCLLWLCIHRPELFLDKAHGNEHERLKKLLLAVKALNPNCDVQLVIKNLEFDKNGSDSG